MMLQIQEQDVCYVVMHVRLVMSHVCMNGILNKKRAERYVEMDLNDKTMNVPIAPEHILAHNACSHLI